MTDSGAGPLPPDAPESTSPSPSRLFLVRHAQSAWNRDRRIQGQTDSPLSELGRGQAALLAERLAGGRWVGLWSSDLRRARETAAALEAALGLAAELDAGLREIGLGGWEGRSREEIEAEDPGRWEMWRREPDWDVVPGSEGTEPFRIRVEAAMARIAARHPGGDVLVVTHGGVIQVTLAAALGRPARGRFGFVIGNASVTVVGRREGRLVIERVNDTCHLDALEASPAPESALPR
ncbi:MAG: histidine phosphatase family protein [Candidatus Dormibacterales bacterium]